MYFTRFPYPCSLASNFRPFGPLILLQVCRCHFILVLEIFLITLYPCQFIQTFENPFAFKFDLLHGKHWNALTKTWSLELTFYLSLVNIFMCCNVMCFDRYSVNFYMFEIKIIDFHFLSTHSLIETKHKSLAWGKITNVPTSICLFV